MQTIIRLFHLKGLKYYFNLFLVNKIYAGTNPKHFEKKRNLLNAIGYHIGPGTKIVGPIECTGMLIVGKDTWIGKNLKVNGNGTAVIGDRCDLAPEVTFQTGGHQIGSSERRAGKGMVYHQEVGSGTWIGGRTTVVGNVKIGKSCVVAGCSCVIKDVEDHCLIGGVPAKVIRRLPEDEIPAK